MTTSHTKAAVHLQKRPPISLKYNRLPIFWSYVRYSTPPQQWGDSDRRQWEAGRHRAEELGMQFVDSYRDLGISAFHSRNKTNGALGRFLEDLQSPPRDDPWPMPGDILHCENLDRLSRADPEESLKLFMEIIESGIILMVREQQYTREIMRRERWRWQVVLGELIRAHEESLRKQDLLLKTYEGNRERARNHQRALVGNRCPGWLRPIRDRQPGQWPLYEFVPPPKPEKLSRADMYRKAWEMIDGGLGSPTIANRFNKTAVPVLAKRVHGKPTQGWTAQLVRQLLRNPAAMGVYRQKKLVDGRRVVMDDCEDVEGYYPALVSPVLFQRVDAALKARAGKAGKGPQGETYTNLFKGLCVCEANHDQSYNIGYKSKEGLHYLRCEQSRHGNCPNTASFQYETFERLVLDLSSVGMQETLANLLPKPDADPRNRHIAELEATIVSREEQVNAAWNRWLSPDGKATQSMRDRAEQQIERMDTEIAYYRAEVAALRQELQIIAAHDDAGFQERVREAKAQLATARGEELKAIRTRLAQELCRRIEQIIFDDDGGATLRIREHQGLSKVDVRLAPTGIEHIDIIAGDGSVLTRFDGAGLALLNPISAQVA